MSDIKLLSTEIALSGTANNVASGSLVRVVNVTSNYALLTKKNATGDTLGTMTIGPYDATFGEAYIIKAPSDTLTSNAAGTLYACSIGYY